MTTDIETNNKYYSIDSPNVFTKLGTKWEKAKITSINTSRGGEPVLTVEVPKHSAIVNVRLSMAIGSRNMAIRSQSSGYESFLDYIKRPDIGIHQYFKYTLGNAAENVKIFKAGADENVFSSILETAKTDILLALKMINNISSDYHNVFLGKEQFPVEQTEIRTLIFNGLSTKLGSVKDTISDEQLPQLMMIIMEFLRTAIVARYDIGTYISQFTDMVNSIMGAGAIVNKCGQFSNYYSDFCVGLRDELELGCYETNQCGRGLSIGYWFTGDRDDNTCHMGNPNTIYIFPIHSSYVDSINCIGLDRDETSSEQDSPRMDDDFRDYYKAQIDGMTSREQFRDHLSNSVRSRFA